MTPTLASSLRRRLDRWAGPRAAFLVLASCALAAAPHLAAQQTVNTRIATNPSGLPFYVDGQYFNSPQIFTWPAGTKHTIWSTQSIDGLNPGTRYEFQSWQDPANQLVPGPGTYASFLADPKLTSITGTFAKQYEVKINFFQCAVGANCPDAPGAVYVNGTAYMASTSIYLNPGPMRVTAIPNPGFVFVGFNEEYAVSGQGFITVNVAGPMVLSPRFSPAKRITIQSDPPNLIIWADRAPLTTPAQVDWALGSKHVLSAPASQLDLPGRPWVLGSWSFGGGYEATYTVGDRALPAETIVAKFVPGVHASFLTEPDGLKLNIAGRDNWVGYNFVWGVGQRVTISAPAEQFDSSGRKWVFQSWSNGGPRTQDVVMDSAGAANGFRLKATFVPWGQLRITSVPAGVVTRVDGAACVTPCKLDRAPGTQVRISAPDNIAVSEFSRLDFGGWGDANTADRSYTFSTAADSLSFSYSMAHRLFLTSDPPNAIDVTAEPASPDGFYPAGTTVNVTAGARPGFKFRRWSGDQDTNFSSVFLSLSAPRFLTANADAVAYIPPAGIRNAAAETPDKVVAPGSLIAITGFNLAPREDSGPLSPMAQSLGGTAVMLGDRILPLVYAGPQQITALLPSDLGEGSYLITVRPENMPEVNGPIQVARNAPGLFTRGTEDRPYASALHEDGSLITPDSPAKRGETITLLGTGFGPYNRPVIDGFALPASPEYKLADTVDVLAGDLVMPTAWAGGMAKLVATHGVKIKIGADLPAGDVKVRVRVNGRESNTVTLPVQP